MIVPKLSHIPKLSHKKNKKQKARPSGEGPGFVNF